MRMKYLYINIIIFLLIVVASYFSLNNIEQKLLSDFRASERQKCELVKTNIINSFENIFHKLEMLSSIEDTASLSKTDVNKLIEQDKLNDNNENKLYKSIEKYIINDRKLISSFYVIGNKGHVLYRFPWKPDKVGSDYSDRKGINKIIGGHADKLLYPREITKSQIPSLVFLHPVYENNKLVVILRSVVSMDRFSKFFLKGFEGYDFAITNSDNDVIADTKTDDINKKYFHIGHSDLKNNIVLNMHFKGAELNLRMIPDTRDINEKLFYVNLLVYSLCFLFLLISILLTITFDEWKKIKVINQKLSETIEEIKVLQGIIPICSFCKKIRNDDGYWQNVEQYVAKHSDALFSHSFCPDCVEEHFGYLENKKKPDQQSG